MNAKTIGVLALVCILGVGLLAGLAVAASPSLGNGSGTLGSGHGMMQGGGMMNGYGGHGGCPMYGQGMMGGYGPGYTTCPCYPCTNLTAIRP